MSEHDRTMPDSVDALDLPDVLGKIDALLGRRVGFVPGPKLKSLEEEFPLLTDVVGREVDETSPAQTWHASDRAVAESPGASQRQEPVSTEPAHTLERLLQDMFIRQQIRLEESVRRIVREELDRYHGKQG